MSNEEPNAPAALIARIRGLSRPLEPKPTALKPRLKRLEGIRAVLFDVYGTLVISASGDIAAGEESENTEAFHAALDKAVQALDHLGCQIADIGQQDNIVVG